MPSGFEPTDLSSVHSICATESRNVASMMLDSLSARDIAQLMNNEDASIAAAIATQIDPISRVMESVAQSLSSGGRLIYVGAGTSGRLGVLDASECPPTFNTRPEQVVGIIAGGLGALVRSVEGAEDQPEDGAAAMDAIKVQPADTVVGIASSGRTPYVIGAVTRAREIGATTAALVCNANSPLKQCVDHLMEFVVGPEVVCGSTRLKAGTATKMVLNMLTTGAMVLIGKTYENLMVDLRASNEKLKERTRRIVGELTGLQAEQATTLLQSCDGELKTAIVSHQAAVTPNIARDKLAVHDGHLRSALESISRPKRANAPLILGLDVGGTKCQARASLASKPSEAAQVWETVGANLTLENPRAVCQKILNVVRQAEAEMRGQCESIVIGMAGAGDRLSCAKLEELLSTHLPDCKITVSDDGQILLNASGGRPAIAVVSGTGSIAIGQAEINVGLGLEPLNDPPNIQRAGGWGPLLGDGGSGYGVAMEYLRRCVRKLDPRPCGDLGDEAALRNEKPAIAALMNELQVKDLPDLKRLANDATQRSKIAGAARLILDFAGQGDVLADRVMRIHAAELANQAFQIWESIGSPKRDWDLVLAGGLLVGSEAFRGCFLADLTERASSPRETLIVEAPSVVALQLATLQWSP